MVESERWRNRIIAYEIHRPSEIADHPGQWRNHPKAQANALIGVLNEIGKDDTLKCWYSERNGGALTAFDGHLRKSLDPNEPWPCIITDLTDAEADYALATHDPLSAMAQGDAANLDALLATVNSGDAAVQQMLSELAKDNGLDYGAIGDGIEHKSLSERFIVPPFSILDARQGYWQERKRAWLSLGIQSELGRGDCMPIGVSSVDAGNSDWGIDSRSTRVASSPGGSQRDAASLGKDGHTERGDGHGRSLARTFGQDLMKGENQKFGKRLTWVAGDREYSELDPTSRKILAAGRKAADQRSNLNNAPLKPPWAVSTGTENMASGTSIFDPVLCELAYRWFCPPGGRVLDPFAGGSVRGIVAAMTGREYTGVDLRAEQVAANEEQAAAITPNHKTTWIVGDSRNLSSLAAGEYDFIFTCPPYFDLELYSDNPADLSNAGDYGKFIGDYRAIIAQAIALLEPDRFACVVVGDIRDKKGFYRNFVADTISAFQDAGVRSITRLYWSQPWGRCPCG